MNTENEKLNKGYTCEVCQMDHKFPAYVYSHWRELLEHECECGAKYEIVLGRARLLTE